MRRKTLQCVNGVNMLFLVLCKPALLAYLGVDGNRIFFWWCLFWVLPCFPCRVTESLAIVYKCVKIVGFSCIGLLGDFLFYQQI